MFKKFVSAVADAIADIDANRKPQYPQGTQNPFSPKSGPQSGYPRSPYSGAGIQQNTYQGYNAPAAGLECIGLRPVLTKYHEFFALKAAPNFSVCHDCYRTHIQPNHDFIYEFEPHHSNSPEEAFACDLVIPAIRSIFFQQCVPRRITKPLIDFSKLCETLTPCDGSAISTRGRPYWQARRNKMENFVSCETCFELYFKHTTFEHEFEKVQDGTIGGIQQWTCDMAKPYFIRLATVKLGKQPPNFSEFADEVNTRISIPPCPGPNKPIVDFTPKLLNVVMTGANGNAGNICLSCFSDFLAETPLEATAFAGARLASDQLGKVTCDLAHGYSQMAMIHAVQQRSVQIWLDAVKMGSKAEQCAGKKGMDEAEVVRDRRLKGDVIQWYQLNSSSAVEICPFCYWTKANMLGAGHMFSPITRLPSPGHVHICFMMGSDTPETTSTNSPDNFADSVAWRGRIMFNALRPGYEAGDWNALASAGRMLAANSLPCGGNVRGFSRGSGRRWYGRVNQSYGNQSDCTIIFCEECYMRSVSGKPHANIFSQDMTNYAFTTVGPNGRVYCNTYTNRARGMVRQCAETGDLFSFTRWWNMREELRKKKDSWKPIIEMQLQKQKLADAQKSAQLRVKLNAQRNALTRMAAAGIVELAGGDRGWRHGNSQVGYGHWTAGAAEAHMDWKRANNMPSGLGGNSINSVMDTQAILMQARQDELNFAAVE
ncbi:hypothetical protein PMAA_003520 [Talaromyces marneffei ATCC 18224]|uniref:Integral membrane protein n=1 Tax=Talaromyces marneffei (strain ATCC 18224 / CBS 334.59 / QM 7333) TaxID=441960 RepID=B6QT01_TALMQ|nr:hypothetical protein PMAA_003520 [Talaromyces marneffei ATCC 18224]